MHPEQVAEVCRDIRRDAQQRVIPVKRVAVGAYQFERLPVAPLDFHLVADDEYVRLNREQRVLVQYGSVMPYFLRAFVLRRRSQCLVVRVVEREHFRFLPVVEQLPVKAVQKGEGFEVAACNLIDFCQIELCRALLVDIGLRPAELCRPMCIEKRGIGLEGVVELEHLVAQSRFVFLRRHFQALAAVLDYAEFRGVIFRCRTDDAVKILQTREPPLGSPRPRARAAEEQQRQAEQSCLR